ncbi:MAG: DsbA family protein [Thiohalocapsa sp.]
MKSRLYYIHDPMCSWCYGFAPVLAALLQKLPPDIAVLPVLGGLAPDSNLAMPAAMRARLKQTWREIEQRIPGTVFNFDFWQHCTPRRSTYRACRAVLVARTRDPALGTAMTAAIQRAYYREARNPSDRDTLIELAAKLEPCLGLLAAPFAALLDAPETKARLFREIASTRALGVDSFPSLVLELTSSTDQSRWPIPVDYREPGTMYQTITRLLDTGLDLRTT